MKKNITNKFLDILFVFAGASLLVFNKEMSYVHGISIALMILMAVKCYYRGIKNGIIWLGLVTAPVVVFMFKSGGLGAGDFSGILLIVISSLISGLLGEKQRLYVRQLKETYLSTLKTFADIIDARDPYTHGHSERVARYAVSIAQELSVPEKEVEFLEKAALLHDIGKIAVPDHILHKKGPLSDDEWQIMKKHPEHSHRILSRLNFLSPILSIVLYHHQRVDNNGYPEKGPHTTLPLTTRILMVADAFDAMTSDRPYRKGLSREQALRELEKGSGSQFDPEVIEVFKRVQSL